MEVFPLTDVLARLDHEKTDFLRLLRTGQFDISLYKPDRIDTQTPHARDEVYVVATGAGLFACDGVERAVTVGDALFVPAGVEHRFVEFSADFATWVIFFGAPPQAKAPTQ
jgi:mannose-6-phosphate isomerase-like protein (cupin superfamily)